MRIAVLADIHGNLRALEAVQRDLRKQSPDLIVNLGDHVSGPLQAAATADALMAESYVSIRGNHDRELVERPADHMTASDRAADSQLESRHRAWLRSLPALCEPEPGILLCHGSPEDDLDCLLEDIREDGVHLASAAAIGDKLNGIASTLVLCAHSHVPRAIAIRGGPQIVNPGSIGLPAYDGIHPWPHFMETGSPHARYALLDREGSRWRIAFIAIEYDWLAASEEARRANRADWAQALATGYALRPA
jgi:predicted phosphodiesterase